MCGLVMDEETPLHFEPFQICLKSLIQICVVELCVQIQVEAHVLILLFVQGMVIVSDMKYVLVTKAQVGNIVVSLHVGVINHCILLHVLDLEDVLD